MYAKVSDLPLTIRSALLNLNYHKKDITVKPSETFTQQSLADKGQRGFTVAVNIETGESKAIFGSWGGSNMFVANAVDSDDEQRNIPPGFIVIQGTQGYPKTFASIYINPDNVALMLPAQANISKREDALLAVIKGHTSAGRKDFWRRYPKSKPTAQELDELIKKGLLKQNSNGAISITTEGKNAVTVDSHIWYQEQYGDKNPFEET